MTLQELTVWNYRKSMERAGAFSTKWKKDHERARFEITDNQQSERQLRSNISDEWEKYQSSIFGA